VREKTSTLARGGAAAVVGTGAEDEAGLGTACEHPANAAAIEMTAKSTVAVRLFTRYLLIASCLFRLVDMRRPSVRTGSGIYSGWRRTRTAALMEAGDSTWLE
jgi:hypothetical protein